MNHSLNMTEMIMNKTYTTPSPTKTKLKAFSKLSKHMAEHKTYGPSEALRAQD